MKTIYKSKSQLRTETADALEQFLASGGVIEVVKSRKMRRRTTQKMAAKSSRGFQTGTSGFATGYPRKAIV